MNERMKHLSKHDISSSTPLRDKACLPSAGAFPDGGVRLRAIRPIRYIVLHCSATREGRSLTPAALERMHRDRGFSRTGYHYYIRRDGTVHATRPLNVAGAHAKGHNAYSIGICYEGGLDRQGNPKDTRTPRQRAQLHRLVSRLREFYPSLPVYGHRDLSPDRNGDGTVDSSEWLKQCPCFDVAAEF